MRPRRFTELERALLAKVWPVPGYTVLEMCQTFRCSTKTIRREVRALGLPPRRVQRSKHGLAHCERCGAELASRTGRRCRPCFESGKPQRASKAGRKRRYITCGASSREQESAPTPTVFRCPWCGGKASDPEGHSGCVMRNQPKGRAA